MPQNILILTGSPRQNGNTNILTDAFVEGAKENGNVITRINVCKYKISGCVSCQYCTSHNGECALKDGMDEIYSLLENVDIVVFATPIYYYGFSSQLKAVIDRFHAKSAVGGIKPMQSILLAVGADDLSAFEPLIVTYKAILNYLKWENIGILAVDGVEEKGAIHGNDGLIKARILGATIKTNHNINA